PAAAARRVRAPHAPRAKDNPRCGGDLAAPAMVCSGGEAGRQGSSSAPSRRDGCREEWAAVGPEGVRAPGRGPSVSASTGPGPLAGVLVIELGMLLAGPFCGRLLGDMGADVIKIESPGQPDPLRDWGKARYEGHSLWWPVQSRNKRCCTLNLRTERGQELLLELVKHADALVENFRPGTLERWKIGPAELLEANPKLVIARVSGYGQTGPYAARAGFASVAEAMGGLRHINGFPGEDPPRMHISLGDSLPRLF